ncbi:hypothetical protein BDA96_03G467100 [Sorghum bicolor]|uniref:KIB1-4 beta-propeller domain-containing protein n=1 Tax=Sorghum bicolor TaxID=4558 RepID=A0A921RKI5_SORBI|nr:hypothetical protein BDA96_03G467100 [Sorghum bicolor]
MEADAMAAQGWSSLPRDLVNRVADCLLATNDLDYYMDLRGVCHNWRFATADPSSNPHRFHPTRWIMLDELESSTSPSYGNWKMMPPSHFLAQDEDEHGSSSYADAGFFSRCTNMFASSDGVRHFVNADTGRFLRRKLPLLLRDYHFVSSTTGGFLVLADSADPHAVRVLNPFTGALVHFKAPAPPEKSMTASVVVVGDQLTLVLAAIRNPDGCSIYLADPGSEEFVVETTMPWAVISTSDSEAAFGLLDPAMRSCVLPLLHRGLAAELGPGEMVRVDSWSWSLLQHQQGVRVFRLLDSAGRPAMEHQRQVTSIGGRALFVGTRRCFSVDAARFPSVEPDCVSTTITRLQTGPSATPTTSTCMISLKLLVEYAMRAPSFEPSWEHSTRAWRTNAATPYYPAQTALQLLLEDADVIQSMF